MFRIQDITKILNEIPNLDEKVDKFKLDNLDLKLKDYKKIILLIKEFISKKRRIIYGGQAQNMLIENKHIDKGFYKEYNQPYADIEQ